MFESPPDSSVIPAPAGRADVWRLRPNPNVWLNDN
ncbi:hypothetical protein X949_4596 [Burkholderia pseudomallei MSHR5609]|nr:hypothetical protein DO65_4545 [Burkholderia pseudomallei]KGR96468.1 hypothetical protein X948_4702 [Burkholderia pseudomallei MSHR5608]KGS18261.1 hypothetical protein X989_4732 [Burkholderia pseudomallei MSHR4378]KGS56074.1 hypothetical protein X949_4596 [Burkholderia pseudomallei MSHR5609]KGS61836.1 hypothetical protein X990_4961 [Burkholderia pseudomallei MSHR4868]KGW79586.1 hypothetical protein Y046_5302 [Burkholderia pseudomallei MSHR2990]KGW94826.1 hypothetical protein Y034_3659 [Bur